MLEPIQATGYTYAMGTDDQQQKDLLLILRGMACITYSCTVYSSLKS